jgi:RNA polymerase sigma-70 factor, ECF subfamily
MPFELRIQYYMTNLLNHFLAENERRAFRMAQMATGHKDDALDIVQDAMIKLVQKYSDHSPTEWGPLFHRILQRQITDWHRSNSVKRRIFKCLSSSDEQSTESYIEELEDPIARSPDKLLQNDQAIDVLQSALQQLPMRQRQTFLLRYRWRSMSPKQRMEKFKQMTPEKQQKIKQRYQHFKQLSPEQQQRLRERRQWLKSLPEEKRQQMRQKWQAMTPEQRKQHRQKWQNMPSKNR